MIKIDGAGRVLDFAMNDKCAAGTGRFLEVMARALEVDLEGSVKRAIMPRHRPKSAASARYLRNPK
ncbi:MAG: BadF/BadG/BcrA/BcrD ATPase family protein [Desulfobacterales bacterium]